MRCCGLCSLALGLLFLYGLQFLLELVLILVVFALLLVARIVRGVPPRR